MQIRKLFTLLLTATLALTTLPVAAQDGDAGSAPTTRAMVEAQLLELKGQLNLGDYEWTQVEQILKSGIRERVAITRRYGLTGDMDMLEPLEGSEKRALKRELKDSRKDTEKRMKRYLDKDQFKAFKALQEEIYASLLERADTA